MARIFITGSADGLGLNAAKKLIANGHSVVLHARNAQRANEANEACPGAETVAIGDLSTIAETKALAGDLNKLGTFDCVIHNAGLFRGPYRKTADGVPALVGVNVLAPYLLTSLMHRPKRIVFLSSLMHNDGDGRENSWNDNVAYSESKLHNVLFAKAFARRWPDVKSNALDPGWVATKMGGSSATGSLEASMESYTLLAEGTDPDAQKSGRYFVPGGKEGNAKSVSDDERIQDRLLAVCADFTGVPVPS